jgi:hypothetical protein
MFEHWTKITKEANFHWRDVALIIFIGLTLILLTSHIEDKFCN